MKHILGFDPPQFAYEDFGPRSPEVVRQSSGTHYRAIVELHAIREASTVAFSGLLKANDGVDESRVGPRLGEAFRLPQGNDVGCRLFDDAETVKFQLPDNGRLARSRCTG